MGGGRGKVCGKAPPSPYIARGAPSWKLSEPIGVSLEAAAIVMCDESVGLDSRPPSPLLEGQRVGRGSRPSGHTAGWA